MILVDAGPLVALLDANETHHDACRKAAAQSTVPMVTTWPAITEAMHLLRWRAGLAGQQALWRLLSSPSVQIADLTGTLAKRAAALMDKYADLPMDLADASLVAVAEDRGLSTIFTLDKDFSVYRLHGKKPFTLVP